MISGFTEPHVLSGRPPETPILVALSGGADSVALLAVLRAYAEQHGTPLRIAHVNHGIRGEEAIRDRDFCVSLAQRWEIPISVLDADVPRLCRERGGGTEEVARAVRYEFFARVMAEYDIPLLATAHHADDQLETILLRLTRGTGPDGLCGIPPIRTLTGGRLVIRPLLGCDRSALLAYCREHRLDYVVDSTNEDISYARNRIRHEVIPHLRAINPAVTDAAARLVASLHADMGLLTEQTDAVVRESVSLTPRSDGAVDVSVSCECLSALPHALRRRVLVRMMQYAGCPQAEERFVRALCAMACGEGAAGMSLPGGVSARREGDVLRLCRESDGEPVSIAPVTVDLTCLPARVTFGEIEVTAVAAASAAEKNEQTGQICENVYKMSMIETLNSATIKGSVQFRTRRAGDSFLWRGHHRKVKKLLCDRGVPREVRDCLPLLCDGEGILWIPGIGVRDDARARGGEGDIVLCATPSRETVTDPTPAPMGRTDEI